ncbi:MAG: M20 family peptidase, partial [Anaerovoracaceae bacterium]
MLEKNKLKQIYSAENEIASELENISDFIYKNPEIGMEEHIACEYLCRKISDCGFHVKRNFCGIDTAFIAEFDNGPGPSVAFIAEYDALLGFGPSGGPGHACGHNWIAASTFGAFVT